MLQSYSGDEILGFVSQGQGIKVHRKDCPNIQVPEVKARLIDVYWILLQFQR